MASRNDGLRFALPILRGLLCCFVAIWITGCSQAKYKFVQVFPKGADLQVAFSSLNHAIGTWNEFRQKSEPTKNAKRSTVFYKWTRDKSAALFVSLNVETKTLVAGVVQYGSKAFTPEAQDLFEDVARRISALPEVEKILVPSTKDDVRRLEERLGVNE